MSHQDGAAHFGVWNAILMVASRAKPSRGFLLKDDGRPHSEESLARVTRLPEATVRDAVKRLLQIGLLIVMPDNPPENDNLTSQPGAGKPQDGAGIPQDGAVAPHEDAAEGKGIEHHHQERNLFEKNGTRTEPQRTEGARADLSPERSVVASSDGSSYIAADDEKPAAVVYASAKDELKAIYQAQAGEAITVEVLRAIRANLELAGVSVDDFVAVARRHAGNKWRNPAGFLRDLSKTFRAKTRPTARPVTAAEAEAKNYRCASCGSRVRGEGATLCDGKEVPCSCASAEWIERQRARGVFATETTA